MIDQHRDANEQEEAIDPGGEGIDDERAMQTRRKFLRRRLLEAEQLSPQPPQRQCEGTRLQVVHPPQVGQYMIAVEPHERADIDEQGRQQAGGGDEEGRRAPRPFRQNGPQEQGEARQRQLHQDATQPDEHPRPPILQLPGVGNVGVEHRHHDEKRHPHARHPCAEAGGDVGMPQLVRHLHHQDGEAK